jgi:hypothetical protein
MMLISDEEKRDQSRKYRIKVIPELTHRSVTKDVGAHGDNTTL